MIKFIMVLYLCIIMLTIVKKDNKLCPPNKGEYSEMGLSSIYERVLKRCNERSDRASNR
jgi:hypothetical protein